MKFYQLLQRCSLLSNIDLTVESNPVIPAKVAVISSSPVVKLQISTSSNEETRPAVPMFHFPRRLSNITNLILEGRTDIYDSDLHNIAECWPSLFCINLNACTSITDSGISVILLKCVGLHSIFACDTLFGHNSVLSLCRDISRFDGVAMKMEKNTNSVSYKLQILHIGGCKESQDTISNGWPGLISLHLEDCGEVTAKGVTSLMNCQALEDLLLRHNGLGIDKNFIIRAASRMPLLRKVALDVCDAKDGDFDLPDFTDRRFLSIVKIARCNLKRRTLDSMKSGPCTTPVHAETLILTWDSEKLSRTVVKERLW